MLSIHFNGKDSGIKISRALLPWHTPVKRGGKSWEIIDDETGEAVDSYTPPPKAKPAKPITSIRGSWAEQVNKPGFMH